MRLSLLNRKVHYWASAVVALPLLVVICTGLLLQVKKHWSWVQPAEQRGSAATPQVSLDRILAAATSVEELGVSGWADVDRVDVRPAKGLAKVSLHSGHEVQVDLGTGAVLQTAYRRSDWIESLHDGSWFAGDWSKLLVFLPTGAGLLLLWITGLWLFWLPFAVRRRRRRQARS